MPLTKIPNNDLVTITKTQGEKSYVFPGVDPIKVINHLSQEAEVDPSVDLSRGNKFRYYQNGRGWHFTTIDILLKKDTIEDFAYADIGLPGVEFDTSQKIKSLEIEKMPNAVDNILKGLYNQIVETIDPITKQFTVDKFNYAKDRTKFTHVEKDKFSLLSKNSPYNDEFDTGKSIYTISNLGNNYSNLEYIKPASETNHLNIPGDYQLMNPRTVHKNIKFKNPFQNSFNIKLVINIPGNTNIEIGDMVTINIPEPSEVKDDMLKPDKGLGTKYLVTSVRHIITSGDQSKDFFTSLRLVKNNYAHDLEPES